MAADNLLRPDNRLLGWSTGDFGLYGAQPGTTVAFARAEAGPVDRGPPANTGPGDANTTSLLDRGPAPIPHDSGDTSANPADPDTISSSGPAPLDDASVPAADSAAFDPISQPAGGSTAPGLTAQPTVANLVVPDGSDGATRITDGAVDGHAFGIVAPALTALAASPAIVTTQVAQAEDLVRGTAEAIGSLADTAHDAIADVQGDLAAALADVGQGASDALGHASTLDIDQIIFSGSDPAGGISTLVGLVQTSELFAVGQTDAAPSAPDASGSIVDDLIGDAGLVPPPLPLDPLTDHHADPGIHLGL